MNDIYDRVDALGCDEEYLTKLIRKHAEELASAYTNGYSWVNPRPVMDRITWLIEQDVKSRECELLSDYA